jgi:hypothetical protein
VAENSQKSASPAGRARSRSASFFGVVIALQFFRKPVITRLVVSMSLTKSPPAKPLIQGACALVLELQRVRGR